MGKIPAIDSKILSGLSKALNLRKIFANRTHLEGPLPAGDDVDQGGVSNSIADGGTLASFSEEEETQSHN